MRIVAWNIRAGGGRRIDRIARSLRALAPDLVVLSEFRGTEPSRLLGARLGRSGLAHQHTTADADDPARNALLVASRWPLGSIECPEGPTEPGRWLPVRVLGPRPFHLAAMHAPNRVSGRKYRYLDAALATARAWRNQPGLLLGDTNSGIPGIDEQSPAFNRREEGWIEALAAAGWTDTYRHVAGRRRAYTWYSPNGDNGFRLDQAFASAALLPTVRASRYRWAGGSRRAGVSDHAALIVDLHE